MKTDRITIGRDITLTYQVLSGIRKREERRIERERRWKSVSRILNLFSKKKKS